MTVGNRGKRLLRLLLLPLSLCVFSAFSAFSAFSGTLVVSTADPDWTFDNGSARFPPGAQGSLTRGRESLRLNGDFGRGGRFVSAVLATKLPGARELRFKIRTSASRVTVLLETADGKISRVETSLGGGAPEFREISIPLSTPLKSFGFLLNQKDLRTDDGAVEISAIRLAGVPENEMTTLCRVDSADSCFVTPGGAPFYLAVLVGRETFSPEDLRYRCSDYAGREVGTGSAGFDAVTRHISLPAPKSPGYYRFEFPRLGIVSAVVAGNPYTGPIDDFFALDFPRAPADDSGWMRLLKRIGVGWCREPLPWPAGAVSCGGETGGDALERAAAAQGISVLAAFQGAAKPGNGPENLIETARNFAEAATRSESIKAVEAGRRPGLDAADGVPPEFSLALLRSVSARFALDKISASVVGGVGAVLSDDPKLRIYSMYLWAGLLEDIDALSFDSGEPVTEIEARIAAMRDVEKTIRSGRAGIPYWISGAAGEKPAAFVARMVELRALGVAKYFQPSAGMAGADRAPSRAFGVYACLPRVLAFKEYVGDLKIEGATRSRTFSDGEEIVCCLYLEGPAKTLRLPDGLKIRKAAGIDGRPLEIRDGAVPMGDGVVFLYPVPDGIVNFLDVDTPAMKVREIVRKFKPKERTANPVVIQPGDDPASGIRNPLGSRVRCDNLFRSRVFFNNLSDRTVTVAPYLNLPGGSRQVEEEGKEFLRGTRLSFELLPGDRREYEFGLLFAASIARRGYQGMSAANRNGATTSLAMPVELYERAILPVPLTGKASDWIDFSSTFNWWSELGVPQDILAAFRVSARKKGLRFEVEVRERELGPGDAVRLAFQLRRNPDDVSGGVFQYRISAGKVERFLFGRSVPTTAVHAEVLRREDGISRYVIDVPATAFGITSLEKGMYLGVSLAVDSGGGEGVAGTLSWGEGTGKKPVPDLFQVIGF